MRMIPVFVGTLAGLLVDEGALDWNQQVVRYVAVAYYQFYAAQAQVEASEAYLKTAETTAQSAKKKLDSGLGNRPDYLRAQAEVEPLTAMAEQLRAIKSHGPEALDAYLRNVRLALYTQAKSIILEVEE